MESLIVMAERALRYQSRMHAVGCLYCHPELLLVEISAERLTGGIAVLSIRR